MIEIRWHGRGGQGSWTAARMFCMAAALFENQYAMAFPSFGPERRGAPVLGFSKIDSEKIIDRSEVKLCDYVVILDETLIEESTGKGIKENGIVIINSTNGKIYQKYFPGKEIVSIDATEMAMRYLGMPITNTAMMAALMAISGLVGLQAGIEALKKELKPSIVEKNIALLEKTFVMTRETYHG